MDEERRSKIKDKVTQLLGDAIDDNVVDFNVDRVIQSVANYTNISVKELPAEIDTTIVAMCIQQIQTHDWLKGDAVNSISEGDVSVSYGSPADLYVKVQQLNPVTDDFLNELNHFRRLPDD